MTMKSHVESPLNQIVCAIFELPEDEREPYLKALSEAVLGENPSDDEVIRLAEKMGRAAFKVQEDIIREVLGAQ